MTMKFFILWIVWLVTQLLSWSLQFMIYVLWRLHWSEYKLQRRMQSEREKLIPLIKLSRWRCGVVVSQLFRQQIKWKVGELHEYSFMFMTIQWNELKKCWGKNYQPQIIMKNVMRVKVIEVSWNAYISELNESICLAWELSHTANNPRTTGFIYSSHTTVIITIIISLDVRLEWWAFPISAIWF